MIFLLTSDQRCVLIELSQGFRSKLDIFTHSALVLFHYFILQTSNFSRSQSFRDLKESSSGLDLMQLRLSEDIQIVLQQAARTPHPTSHLIMLYACHGEVSVGSDPADEMRECTQMPFVWDALMVKCDAYPQA